jgi:hypothetical protein
MTSRHDGCLATDKPRFAIFAGLMIAVVKKRFDVTDAEAGVTEPRQLRAYLPVVAIRSPSLSASVPVARLGCALRRFSGAVCVWQQLDAQLSVAASQPSDVWHLSDA